MSIGVPINDFIEGTVQAYRKGFNDAIRVLIESEKTIDDKVMKESISEIIKKQGQIKTEWN